MHKKTMMAVLGSTALALVFTPQTQAFNPDTKAPIDTISADDIRAESALSMDEIMDTLPTARSYQDYLQLVPGVQEGNSNPSGTAEVNLRGLGSNQTLTLINGRRINTTTGVADLNLVPAFSTKLRVNYDSNICENYNSGSFFLPSINTYDPRIVDEAMGYVNQLSPEQFLDYVDWLDEWEPAPLAFKGSPLWNALEITDWMTDAEFNEFARRVFQKDNELWGNAIKNFPIRGGLFAEALNPGVATAITTARYGNTAYDALSGFEWRTPRLQFDTSFTSADLERVSQHLKETGGGIAPDSSAGEPVLSIPIGQAYNLDRYKIYADYKYAQQNNITDGSLPTLQYEGTGDPFANYLNGIGAEPTINLETIDPAFLRFSLKYTDGAYTQVDPPTTDLTPVAPVDSVIDKLQPYRLGGQDYTPEPSEWDDIAPRIGLTYELGSGVSLRIPYGKYTYAQTTTETPANTPTGEFVPNNYGTSIQFKIEESVSETDQSNLKPAEEAVVKLGFPVPPMPIEGNPRVDEGASEDPVQGEVDGETGQIKFDVGWRHRFNDGFDLEYKYDASAIEGTDATNTTDGGSSSGTPGETYDWSPQLSVGLDMYPTQGFTLNGDPLNRRLSDAFYESLNNDETPSNTTDTPANDGPSQPTLTDINWDSVRNALGEFADQDALNRVSNTFNGFRLDEPLVGGIQRYDNPFAQQLEDTPSFDGGRNDILRYDTPSLGPVSLTPGYQSGQTAPEPEVDYSRLNFDMKMDKLGSRIVYRTDDNADLGALEQFTTRQFDIGNYKLNSLFYPLQYEAQVQDAIDNNPGIAFNEPNPYRDKQGQDPYYSSEGSWGQDYADQWAIRHVGFTEEGQSAWTAAGEDLAEVIVAVIDTGIDWNHADISWDALWQNGFELPDNGVDDDANGYVDDVVGWDFFHNTNLPWDDDGHGTFVAGLIAATSDNNIGISGINPAAKVMVLKSLDSFGHTRASYLAESIVYAVDNGAQIINLSVGGDGLSHAEELAVQYAEDNGVLVFAAAGNKGYEASNFGFAPYETVVTVGSTTPGDTKSGFSNWGEDIDIVAPGEDVLSLRARRTDLMLNVRHLDYELGANYVGDDKRYYRAAGTSFSAPIVAGIASLIWSKNPDLSHEDVRRMLLQTAKDIDVPGRDQQTGFGLVDATAAINADPAFEIVADIAGVRVIQDGGVFVAVDGTATANEFDRAQISIGAGENPSEWKEVGERIRRPVAGGELTRIPATELQGSPLWIIRVVVTHENGRTREERFVLNLG